MVEEKIKRIEFLKLNGFNTPRMFYIPTRGFPSLRPDVEKFMESYDKVNIRTYDNMVHGEGFNRPHYTKISPKDCISVLQEINEQFVCMVDLEVPGDGRLSGNILIKKDGLVIIDYCHCHGALVRMADKCVILNVKDKRGLIRDEYISSLAEGDMYFVRTCLSRLVTKAISFPYIFQKDFILEWSIQANSCGILGTNLIFWEWRDGGFK